MRNRDAEPPKVRDTGRKRPPAAPIRRFRNVPCRASPWSHP